jgi:membrane protein required for colicin V production
MAIDVLFLAAAAYGFFLGFKEGIVNTVFRTLSIFFALMAAFKFSPYVTEVLEKSFQVYNPLMFIGGFIVTYFLTTWILRFAGDLVTQTMEVAHINLPNQIIGGTVLAGIFTILFSLLVWFADGARLIEPDTKMTSMSYRILEPLPQQTFKVLGELKPTFQKFFQQSSKMMDEVQKSRTPSTEAKHDIYDIPEETPAPVQQPNN